MFITKPERTLSLITALSLAFTILVANPSFGYAQAKVPASKKVEKKVVVAAAPYTNVQVVAKVNEARVAEGLTALSTNSKLTLAAQTKANHMAKYKYFSHWSPDGSAPWDFIERAGYDYQNAGENLAIHFMKTEAMVDAWLKSPGHRANIMNGDYKETGVGIVYAEIDGKKGWVVVQMFGSSF